MPLARIKVIIALFGALVVPAGLANAQGSPDEESRRCLQEIESRDGPSTDPEFDISADLASNTSFACFLRIRASEVRLAIEQLQSAMRGEPSTRMDSIVGFPLEVILEPPLVRRASVFRVRNAREWKERVIRRMPTEQKKLIACATVSDAVPIGGMTYGFVVRGALFIPYGAIRPELQLRSLSIYRPPAGVGCS